MTELQHFPVNSPEDEILDAIAHDGACILDNLVEGQFCDQIMSDFMPYIDSAPWNNSGTEDDGFFGCKTKRFHGLAAMSARCADIISNPILLSLASRFIGRKEKCRALRVSTMELMVLGQGQGNQVLHRDTDSWAYLPRSSRTNLLFSANIAMCDFTHTNGATVVVPGSHTWPDDRKVKEGESCLAVMKKGSALLYSGEAVHGGGNNEEMEIRTGFYIGYIPSWLSGLENHAVSSGIDVIRKFDIRVQHLLDVVEGGFTVIP